MDFRRLVGPMLFARRVAAWFSVKSGVACSRFMEMSLKIRRIHAVCCAVEVALMYSVSQVDSAVIDGFMDPGWDAAVCVYHA